MAKWCMTKTRKTGMCYIMLQKEEIQNYSKKIETFFKGLECKTTCDERTLLHIACINNRTEICKYICSKGSYKSIINSTGEFGGWTAAHYVAVEERQGGTEQNIIRI